MKTEHDFQRYQPGNGSAQDHYRLTGQAGTLCGRKGTTGRVWREGDPQGRMCPRCDQRRRALMAKCDRCTDTGLIQRAFGRDPVPCRCEAATKQ